MRAELDMIHRLQTHAGYFEKDFSAPQKVEQNLTITKLPGDASSRRYYRVARGRSSIVVMAMEPFPSQTTPFLQIQKYLKSVGVDVPHVHSADPERGLIFLEDLGDETLLHRLKDLHQSKEETRYYQLIINQLVDLQVQATEQRAPTGLPAFQARFDSEKLMWELNNTIEHFFEKNLGRVINRADRDLMNESFLSICKTLENEPTVFAHRDFHSRNIMVLGSGKKERHVFIDFQDARLGPAQYDLVSLLRDSYYQLGDDQVTHLIEYYLDRFEKKTKKKMKPAERKRFYYVFDLMTIQRNFKAIGTFASVYNRRQNIGYLKYIGNTFENIRRALQRNPKHLPLRKVLTHYYYF